MATIVCQGLQSCLESQLVESRALRLRLSSPKPHFSQSLELALKPFSLESNNTREVISDNKCQYEEITKTQKANLHKDNHTTSNNHELGTSCWSFLQDLSNTSLKEMEKEKEEFVHPLVKRSSSTLSEKSLKLCTENLGSETGTDIIENSLFSLSDSDNYLGSPLTREQEKPSQFFGAGKKVVVRNSIGRSCRFPPPLTTISGSESLQVRPHREDGRLILKAVKAPSRNTYFQAERSNGRLRLLCFVKESAHGFDEENEENNNNEEEEEEIENDLIDHEEEGKNKEKEEDDDEEESECFVGEAMEGNNFEDGVKMGMEDFQRPAATSCGSRCKEGGGHHELIEQKGLSNWNWVATS